MLRKFLTSVALVATLMVAGCTGGQLNQDALRAVKVPFQLYAEVYQPLLINYGRLPDCETTDLKICRDYTLYSKLVEVDGKAVVAMQLANEAVEAGVSEGDVLTRASTAVADAMNLMAPLVAQAQTQPTGSKE